MTMRKVYRAGGELLKSTGDVVGQWKEYSEDLLHPIATSSEEKAETNDLEGVSTITEDTEVVEDPQWQVWMRSNLKMWSTSESSSEETLLCSICLEVFSEPVSTPCGHNFCKRCICEAWDTAGLCTCPLCKRNYSTRPELSVNTLLRELVSQRKLEKNKSRSMEEMPTFAEVQCDVCSEPKLKALKSCLVCLSSFCETHLQPHLTVSGLKRHQLMEPVENLEDRLCPKHQRPLELFCDTDQSCICTLCGLLEHKTHDLLSLDEAAELHKELSDQFNKLCRQLVPESNKVELRRKQKFEVDVTLDPDTAHPWLVLSEDLKQVHHTDVRKQLPDSPLRFDYCAVVLGKQSFSSGRFYFEVQVKEKTDWDLGVSQKSVHRKGKITASPKNGFWCIALRNKDEYRACADSLVRLFPSAAPQKVGVFVDYDEGLVSFYDTDSADLLFSFTGCSFTEKLFPFFSPCLNDKGSNSAPLVVSAVETFTDAK
ncbi:hypothetical protein WMY93_009958 [Mugilogobius chulae]|uniref:E3 ubiquitin-protein ligase TRIM39-like n=1 Tax=Mugilogobius chulae TaxID=88201 RepID=A0AAW0P9R0_9GOBI